MPCLQCCMAPVLYQVPAAPSLSIEDLFGLDMFQDCWLDARMDSVLAYLRGDRKLFIPDNLKRLLPTEIPPRSAS